MLARIFWSKVLVEGLGAGQEKRSPRHSVSRDSALLGPGWVGRHASTAVPTVPEHAKLDPPHPHSPLTFSLGQAFLPA